MKYIFDVYKNKYLLSVILTYYFKRYNYNHKHNKYNNKE